MMYSLLTVEPVGGGIAGGGTDERLGRARTRFLPPAHTWRHRLPVSSATSAATQPLDVLVTEGGAIISLSRNLLG